MNITDKFKRGLVKYGLNLEDLQKYKYYGGDDGSHLKYLKLISNENEIKMLKAEHSDECVCGQGIVRNCYITDGENIIILGNCCIKRFVPKCFRTCEKCEERHKNRIVNRCNKCRVGCCDKCGGVASSSYKLCSNCYYNAKCFKGIY